MAASYERVLSISRIAGADYSGYEGSNFGEYHFAVVNPDEVTGYTNPDNPGRWYGSDAGPPAIPPGNVLINADAGAYCPFVIVGKSLPGQPIDCAFAGRVTVIAGGTVTAGDLVGSDDLAQAVVYSSGSKLGVFLSSGVAGDIVDILFNPQA